MKFKGRLFGAHIDVPRYQQQLQGAMEDALHDGANAWLRAVVGKVPLWSGMARASLLELSELVSGTVVFTPLRAKSRIPQGRRLGSAEQLFENDRITITIRTDVPHYSRQETSSGVSPTAPWRSLQAGAAAYMLAIQNFRATAPILKPIKIKAI
jgi:hypothetical protein